MIDFDSLLSSASASLPAIPIVKSSTQKTIERLMTGASLIEGVSSRGPRHLIVLVNNNLRTTDLSGETYTDERPYFVLICNKDAASNYYEYRKMANRIGLPHVTLGDLIKTEVPNIFVRMYRDSISQRLYVKVSAELRGTNYRHYAIPLCRDSCADLAEGLAERIAEGDKFKLIETIH